MGSGGVGEAGPHRVWSPNTSLGLGPRQPVPGTGGFLFRPKTVPCQLFHGGVGGLGSRISCRTERDAPNTRITLGRNINCTWGYTPLPTTKEGGKWRPWLCKFGGPSNRHV